MKSSTAAVFMGVFCVPFGLFCLIWTVIFTVRAQYLSAIVSLGTAVFLLGYIAMLALVANREVIPRVSRDDSGTTFRPDRRVDRLLMVASFAAFVAMVVYAIFAPLEMLNIRPPRGYERYLVIACASGAFVSVFSLRQIVRRRGTSYLRMTVHGIETGTTMTSEESPWDDVTDVADRKPNARHANGATYIIDSDGRPRELPTHWYTPDGHALRELMRFYWQHPDDREELADGRAIRRLEAVSRGAS
ncbi:hypothetical protein [Mycobacterium sp. GA-1285]|uniref:hypothetical protein n=1 Tax=Mycobacterium sp. GA-1285 TaxID=1772282 RepID=UPI000B0D3317|nr:hypothetical protein [Mycobacterium sp. GA-1285]